MTHGTAHMPFADYLNNGGLFVVSLLLSFTLGRILHELTHVLAANILGHQVKKIELHPLKGRVEYEVDADTPIWHIRAINLAPLVVGVVAGVGFVVIYWNDLPGLLALYVLSVGWFAYTLMGAASDYSLTAAQENGQLWNSTREEQLLLVALGLLAVAFISMRIDMFGKFKWSALMGFATGAVGVTAMAMHEIRSSKT